MGCSVGDTECGVSESPPHQVTVSRGFWIGQTEVTQLAYRRVTGANPSWSKGDKLPVEAMSWNDAKAYCDAVDLRLPTEAEWEYAARGGSPLGRYGPLDDVAWYDKNSQMRTHEVATKQKNGYGLYDMLGNLWEWTSDFYDLNYYETNPAPGNWRDPKGPSTGNTHTARGGSFNFYSNSARASSRYEDDSKIPSDFSEPTRWASAWRSGPLHATWLR